jgi:hypothetical protein
MSGRAAEDERQLVEAALTFDAESLDHEVATRAASRPRERLEQVPDFVRHTNTGRDSGGHVVGSYMYHEMWYM